MLSIFSYVVKKPHMWQLNWDSKIHKKLNLGSKSSKINSGNKKKTRTWFRFPPDVSLPHLTFNFYFPSFVPWHEKYEGKWVFEIKRKFRAEEQEDKRRKNNLSQLPDARLENFLSHNLFLLWDTLFLLLHPPLFHSISLYSSCWDTTEALSLFLPIS